MRILISGASGMVGSAVAPFLMRQGHEVIHLVRQSPRDDEIQWNPDGGVLDAESLEAFDGVVHLASMPWAGRWTSEFKQKIRRNRIGTNNLLAGAVASRKRKPRVLICASGVGIYAPGGEQILTETSPLGSDFLATLQCDGEAATAPASEAGIRVVHLRIPTVIAGPIARRRMGRLGSGRQWSSWISRDDMAGIIHHILVNASLTGPVNPTSPNPVRNADFAATQARILGSRPGIPISAFFLRLLIGEMADALILASRRVIPRKLLDSGYSFRLPELEGALRHEIDAN